MTHYGSMLRLSPANATWLILYLATLLAVLLVLLKARRDAVASLATPAASAEWERWRAEAVRQSEGTGPVQRRIPASDAPPSLILLRDHFLVCLVGASLLTSALFATLMVMVRGVLAGRRFEPAVDDEPGRQARRQV